MVRIKRGNVARKRRKKVLALAKGFRGAHSRLLILTIFLYPPYLIGLNRKMLSQLSILDPETFDKIQTLATSK